MRFERSFGAHSSGHLTTSFSAFRFFALPGLSATAPDPLASLLGEPLAMDAGRARDKLDEEKRLLKPLLGGEIGADGSFRFPQAAGRNDPASFFGGGDGFSDELERRLPFPSDSGKSANC